MDELVWLLMGSVVVVATVVGIPLAWVAFFRVRALEASVRRLEAALAAGAGAAESASLESGPGQLVQPPPLPPEAFAEAEATGAATAGGPTRSGAAGLEAALGRRWLFWLGGAALALGGAFLVKVVVEEDLLGPAGRALVGWLSGLALLGAGVLVRLRPGPLGLNGTGTGRAAAALGAGGTVTLLASSYAAASVDQLVPPLVGLALAVLASGLALLASWVLGPLLALIGLVGGWAAPLLMASETPASAPLFVYLALLVPVGVGVGRLRGWLWPGVLTLLAVLFWGWLGVWHFPGDTTDPLPPVLFLLWTPPWFVALLPFAAPFDRSRLLALVAVALCGLLAMLAILVRDGVPDDALLLAAVAQAVLVIALARWREAGVSAGLLALAALVLLFLGWALPAVAPDRYVTGEPDLALPPVRLLPALLEPFAWRLGVSAALLVAAALVAMRGARRPGAWAALAVTVALALLATAYLKIAGTTPSRGFAILAVLLAAAATLGAAAAVKRGPRGEGALAAFAVGALGALALGATMLLEQAWLTVALAAIVAATAGVWRRVPLRPLRALAGALALLVVVRVIGDAATGAAVLEGAALPWLGYALGLPAGALLVAATLVRRDPDDALALLLEAAAAVIAVLLLVALAARAGALVPEARTTQAAAVLIVALLTASLGLQRLAARGRASAGRWAEAALGLALVRLAGLVLADLPAGAGVGTGTVLNTLTLGLALPIPLLTLIARGAEGRARTLAAAAALALGLIWPLLAIRHHFAGPVLFPYGATWIIADAESWGYSAWLVIYAVILLALGILARRAELRWTSLAVLMLGVSKVFLLDLAGLEGLWRVASFLGLGLVLVAIGLAYQRFVLTREPEGPIAGS
jgi:uncharacterized membrane protein